MNENIFCINCGAEINYNQSVCSCEYSMSSGEKSDILHEIRQINSSIFVDPNVGLTAKKNYKKVNTIYSLSSWYISSGSARNAFNRKVQFIQDELIPSVNFWAETLSESDDRLAQEKVMVYRKLYEITNFIINEFFGRFSIGENRLKFFERVRNLSAYEIREIIEVSNIDISDIVTTNIGTIGESFFTGAFDTFNSIDLTSITDKRLLTNDELKFVGAAAAVGGLVSAFSGLSNMIAETSEAIKQVREADFELTEEIEEFRSNLHNLSVKEKELNKIKRFYNNCETIIDFTFNHNLLPVKNSLEKNSIYINYRKERLPHDFEQEKIQMDEQILNQEIRLSFWKTLFGGKKSNFTNSWKKRINIVNLESRYNEINSQLKETNHNTLEKLNSYKLVKTENLKKFEKTHRGILRQEVVWRDNFKKVMEYAEVFKNVNEKLGLENV